MKAIVVGGSGQIGGWLLRVLAERGHEAIGTYASYPAEGLHQLDAGDRQKSAEWVRSQRPDLIFYPAGFTWVDGCERDPARAYAANLEEPWNLARIAAEQNARFVYFSTDYVFDGLAGPHSEDAPTHPLSVYGQAKRDAELALASALGEGLLTIRTAWVFGPERQGKNFAYQVLKRLAEGGSAECPSDQLSNPSYGPEVALAAVLLAERGESGLIHAVGPKVYNRVEFARKLVSAFGLDPGQIAGKTTAELGQTTPRPLQGGLTSDKIQSFLPGILQPLDVSLEHFRTGFSSLDDPLWKPPFSRPD